MGRLKLHYLTGNKIQKVKYQRKFSKLRLAVPFGDAKMAPLFYI